MCQNLLRVRLVIAAAYAVGIAGVLAAADPPADKANEDGVSEIPGLKDPKTGERNARDEFVLNVAKKFEFRVGDTLEVSPLREEPLLIWTNPVSGTKSGVLVLYTRGGRPDALAQISFVSAGNCVTEFHNCFTGKLEMRRQGGVLWTPTDTLAKWQILDTDVKPAKTPQLRLAQIRQLAREFKVEDNFGWRTKELQPLRLLTTPVYRYGKEGEEIVDGALFVMALATDPEAMLMIECFKNGEELGWRYAFSPMSIYEMRARRNEKVVWEVPERRVFGARDFVQYVGTYVPDPGESVPQ
jgi:hypothetical protein